MNAIDIGACEDIGGGLTPMGFLSLANWLGSIGAGLYNTVGYLGGTLRNYYGEEVAIDAFRGGNLGA